MSDISSIFRLKIHIFRLQIRIFRLKIYIFRLKIEILTDKWNFILGVSKKNPKPFCFFLACITEMLYICIVNQPSINIKIPTHELERNEEEGGRKRI